jgi:hypothetical protein
VAVIESKLKLIKVAINMLHGALVVRANDRSFEKTPNILKRVGVRVRQTAHVLTFVVVNRDVDRIVVTNSDVTGNP